MKILSITNDHQKQTALKEAVAVLRSGGIVVYPTETCYGIGADALNQGAIDTLLSYKRRREGKPLSVLVKDKQEASQYVEINESADRIYDQLLPGPVTVVSKVTTDMLAEGVASELGTLGIRISSHLFAMALAEVYEHPITATSANASWKKKPYTVDDILNPLNDAQKEKIDLIIDAGQLPKRESSTVVDTTLVGGMILREGDLKIDGVAHEYPSESPDQTRDLAKRLILKEWNQARKHGLVFALTGDLGVGKTVFAQGIGEFLKINQLVVSPSYTLVNEYEYSRHDVTGKLYHIDPWRLASFDELLGLEFDEMLQPNNIVVIEWANKFKGDVIRVCEEHRVKMVEIVFKDLGEDKRMLSLSA